MRTLLLTLLITCASLACGARDTDPRIENARLVLPPPGGHMAAGYFDLVNPGHAPVRIVGIDAPGFRMAEIHQTVIVDGVSRMREIADPVVPAGSTRAFEPGGWHLMLMGFLEDPVGKESQTITLQLQVGENAPVAIPIDFPVKSLIADE